MAQLNVSTKHSAFLNKSVCNGHGLALIFHILGNDPMFACCTKNPTHILLSTKRGSVIQLLKLIA